MSTEASQHGPYQAFGSYLRTQRQLAQSTLRQLSDLARISNPYLSQIERGLHQPSVAVIRSIAEALDLSADALLAQAAGLATDARPEHASPQTEATIRGDPHLSEAQKAALLSVYRSMVGESASRSGPEAAPDPEPARGSAPDPEPAPAGGSDPESDPAQGREPDPAQGREPESEPTRRPRKRAARTTSASARPARPR